MVRVRNLLSNPAVFVVLTTSVCSANAAIVTYTDKTAFITSTGATSATGTLPDLGLVGSTYTLGTVTFSAAPPATVLFIGASGTRAAPDWTNVSPGNDIAISGVENLNVDFSTPVSSAGFDFVEPSDECYAPCFDSNFNVTLKNGGVVLDSFTFNAPDDVLAFVGVSSSTVFDRMEIVDTTGTIDDEFFGEFYSAVPLPAAVWLFGSGLIGLFGLAKRKVHN
jgi:hypothetical protein